VEECECALRWVFQNGAKYGIDLSRVVITGGSAGGHLSLMLGTAGKPGDPEAKDPVDRESSRVRAVACFFPPTDFLNYGKQGEVALGRGILKDFRAPFDFHELNRELKALVPVTDEARILEIGRQISPVTHVTTDDPPTLIIHGDADNLVPIQQAELMVEKLKGAGVEAKLVVKPGAGHGWPKLEADWSIIADWFDSHLKKEPTVGGKN